MDSDEMQTLWQKYDRKLDTALQLNAFLVRASLLAKVETTIGRLQRGIRVEVAINAIAVLSIGAFIGDHAREATSLAAAIPLDLYALAIVLAGIVQWVRLAQIDFADQTLRVAHNIDAVKLLRARATLWTLVLAPLMWTPLLIVATRACFGIDAIAVFGRVWIAANVAFGIEVLALALLFARRYGTRFAPSSPIRRTLDALAGKNVRAAADQVEALRRYEAA